VELHLAAVQVAFSPALYATPEAFAERMLELGREAVADAGPGPRLVAFPELIGLPLLLTAAGDQRALQAPTFAAALGRLAPAHAQRWLRSAWRARRLALGVIYGHYAVEAYRMWFDAFAAVAQATGAVVVAGSAFLPDVDEEPTRGWHVRDAAVHNAALTLAASGRLLGRTAKVHLTPGAEQRSGLSRGRLEDLHPVATELGAVAVAICLDGFHERVVSILDGRRAQLLVQPSANDAPWDRPWPKDPRRRESEVWLGEGLRQRLQGRRWLRYGINPMLVGEAFGLRPRGRSSIVANVADADDVVLARELADAGLDPALPGLLALAPDAEGEAIVRARVPHPEAFTAGG
jgi:predicted amidohydrolase